MKKSLHFFLSLVALMLMAVTVNAQELADGKYYFKNVGAGLYLGASNNWGTQASLVSEQQYGTLARQEDGTYTLESMVSNGGKDYYFSSNGYMDGPAAKLTITKKNGNYTIANVDGTLYYGYDGNSTVLATSNSAESENFQWQLLTEEEMAAERAAVIAAATAEEPADVTFLITDAYFGRNRRDVSAWTMEANNKNLNGGGDKGGCAESWHSVFSLSQVIANAPKGVYKLGASAFYRQDGTDEEHLPYIYLSDGTNTETSPFGPRTGSENDMSAAAGAFNNGLYKLEPVVFELAEEGAMTVGAKLEENANLWCIWGRFTLTYYGPEASLADILFAEKIAQVATLRTQATELKGNADVLAPVVTALEEALNASESIEATEEAYNTAIAILQTAIDHAQASVVAKPILPAMKAEADKTNVYTAEAYETYYGQWITKYENGTLTLAEAQALQDPSKGTGWHAAITIDNFLLSAWDTNPDFNDAPYYINTWSVEGNNDGTNFTVPFFEYWTDNANSLGEKTLTATLNDVEPGNYVVKAWVRVRAKNGTAAADATGITLSANGGEAVDVTEGEAVGSFNIGEYAANATVAEDGKLTITFNVAADNNISWLSFKNVKYIDIDTYLAELIAKVATLRTQATELKGNADVLAPVVTELEEALNASESIETTEEAYNTAISILQTAVDHAQAYVNAKAYFGKMASVLDNTNVYTKDAYDAVYGTWLAEYNAGTLAQETAATLNEGAAFSNGWHSVNNIDDVLLSAWTIGGEQAANYDKALYINTWSVEGDNDGTNFKVPFFEYWTSDANSLGANTIAATLEGVPAGDYIVKAWVRARAKNGTAAADATGITLSANGGEAVDVTEGEAVGSFNIGEYAANATVAEDGELTITFNVAADNNISWLSFKNVTYEAVPELTLNEEVDNTATLEENNGKKANVTLTRTLKTGSYNTFAVPFNIDAIPTGWTVKELTSSSLDNEGTLSLEFENATSIEAGKPYLVKVASEVANPTFDGVTISSTTTPTKTDAVDFIPTVGATTLSAAEENDPENFLFIGEGNKLYNPSELPSDMKGFRAYFYVKNIGTESAKVRAFNLDFGDGETTGIIELRSEEAGANGEGFYDLMGRSIQGQPTQKGVYIKNGKKVIVK